MFSRTYVYIRVHMRLLFAYMRVPTRTYAVVLAVLLVFHVCGLRVVYASKSFHSFFLVRFFALISTVSLLTSMVDDNDDSRQEEMLQFHLGLHFDGLVGKRLPFIRFVRLENKEDRLQLRTIDGQTQVLLTEQLSIIM